MEFVMPCVVGVVLMYGLIKRVQVFDVFTNGAKDGVKLLYTIAPTLVGLIVSVTMLKESGALSLLCEFVKPVTDVVGFPVELLPMSILRPVSGGGSTALLNQVLKDYGPDSFLGRCASVIAGSTETTFYAVTIYYSAAKIKKIRHTLVAALAADFVAVVVAVMTVIWLF